MPAAEGWYEAPSTIAPESGSEALSVFVVACFVVSVLVGGSLGLSPANAVFAQEMVMKKAQELEYMIDHPHGERSAVLVTRLAWSSVWG